MRQRIKPGDLYEDCGLHVVWCYLAERERYTADVPWRWRLLRAMLRITDDWNYCGISLYDGSRPRSCSQVRCAPRKLTLDEAMSLRGAWEQGRRERAPGS